MKNKNKLLVINIFIGSLVFSSCTSPEPVNPVKLLTLEVKDDHYKYALGESYLDEAELTIIGTYSNGDIIEYNATELGYICTYLDGEVTKYYALNDDFNVVGEYSLTFSLGGVESNTLSFDVVPEHIYVSSIVITGDRDLPLYEEEELHVSIFPSNYTTTIHYSFNNEDVLDIEKTEDGFSIYSLNSGTASITATSKKSASEETQFTFEVQVAEGYQKTAVKQTYKTLEARSVYNLSSCPLEGTPRLLVIPLWFTDSNKYIDEDKKEDVRQDIQDCYFGTEESTGWHSVSSYYQAESRGKMVLTGTVSNWYSVGTSSATYGVDNSSRTARLVTTAVNWYFKKNPDDSRTNYDYDGDGYLDGVMMIYGCPDYASAGTTFTNFWAYCYWLMGDDADKNNPKPNVFFWASYDFMYSRSTAEERSGSAYGGGDTYHCRIDAHTYVHEMGHVLGLDDYYDYAESAQRNPAGGFSMQDYNVGGHDPFSIFAFGWADAYIPKESMTINIRSFQGSHDLILLTPSWNSYNSPFDEYLLIELYTPTGVNRFDTSFPYRGYYPAGSYLSGIRLWHIDARLVTFNGWSATVNFFNDATKRNATTAFNNTSSGDRITPLGINYADFNLLQLIRKDTNEDYKSRKLFDYDDLFQVGDSFDMNTYTNQFKKEALLNSGKALGWSFSVTKMFTRGGETIATINLVKE